MTNPNTTLPEMKKALVIERTFDAPRELVFKAWTDPKHLAEWWGPAGFTNPVVELDVRPGGALLIHMQGPDGTLYPNKGVFLEVVEPERLVFTGVAFEDEDGNSLMEDQTTVTFTDVGGKTHVHLSSIITKAIEAPEVTLGLQGMKQGWNESLDRLDAFLHAD